MFSVQERKTGAGQYVLIGLVTAVCALPVLIPQNLYGTLFSPEFVTYMLADLNILDNILLPAVQANRGRRGKRRADLVGEARKLMRRLSVSDIETRGITQVSGGQLQRACICRSMINVPEILFADEPTGALNRGAAKEVLAELVKLNRDGMSILMVTHDAGVACSCDRILYLRDGRICGELVLGKPERGVEKRREERVNAWLSQQGW